MSHCTQYWKLCGGLLRISWCHVFGHVEIYVVTSQLVTHMIGSIKIGLYWIKWAVPKLGHTSKNSHSDRYRYPETRSSWSSWFVYETALQCGNFTTLVYSNSHVAILVPIPKSILLSPIPIWKMGIQISIPDSELVHKTLTQSISTYISNIGQLVTMLKT